MAFPARVYVEPASKGPPAVIDGPSRERFGGGYGALPAGVENTRAMTMFRPT